MPTTLLLTLMLLGQNAPMRVQPAKPAVATPAAPAAVPALPTDEAKPLSDLEASRVALVRAQADIISLQRQLAQAQEQLNTLKLQTLIQQATPVREGYYFDWLKGEFVKLPATKQTIK